MGISIYDGKIPVRNGVVVWLDADDVLISFHALFNALLIKNGYKIPPDYLPSKYSYAEMMNEKEFAKFFEMLGHDWPAYPKAFEGAAEFTHKLNEMGCRVIVITSIFSHQGPERIKNLRRLNKIYFDEIYFTKMRDKSDYAKELSVGYVNSRGAPCKHILVDDYAKNSIEFLEKVPNVVASITLDTGYGHKFVKDFQASGSPLVKRLDATSETPQDMYQVTLKKIAKILVPKTKKR